VNFPIRNYTVMVNDTSGPTIRAMPTVTLVMSTLNSSLLERDQMYQVGIEACSDVRCRSSITVALSKLHQINDGTCNCIIIF